jgi:hypothetical protein
VRFRCSCTPSIATVATTSSRLANDVLTALTEAGVRLSVLHGEEDLVAGDVGSDVDLVVEAPLADALDATLLEGLRERGMFPVIHWPYDVAGAATVFFTNDDASEGVQIDTLCDPEGRGKFGVRTDVLLARTEPGKAWPRVDPLYSLLYQLRKRHWKRQQERIPPLVARLGTHSLEAVSAAAAEMFVDPDTVLALAAGSDPTRLPRESTTYPARNLVRRLSRLVSPIGAWVEFSGPGSTKAADLAVERFARFLPIAARANRPAKLAAPAWWLRQVAPVRWRPGLVAGVAHQPGGLADIEIAVQEGGVEVAMRDLVRALSRRAFPA